MYYELTFFLVCNSFRGNSLCGRQWPASRYRPLHLSAEQHSAHMWQVVIQVHTCEGHIMKVVNYLVAIKSHSHSQFHISFSRLPNFPCASFVLLTFRNWQELQKEVQEIKYLLGILTFCAKFILTLIKYFWNCLINNHEKVSIGFDIFLEL